MPDTTSPAPVSTSTVFEPAWTMVQQAWRWYNDHLQMLLRISLIAAAPSLLLQLVLSLTEHPINGTASAGLGITISFGIGFFLWSIFNIFWTILGTVATYQYLRQPEVTKNAWQLFLGAREYFVNYFSTSLVYGLIVFGGVLLLIVPGFIWAVMFSLAPLIAIFEKASTSDALSRSKAMIKGHWFDVFWRGLLLAITVMVVTILAGYVFAGISRVGSLVAVSDLLSIALSAALTPVPLIMTYLIYQKLSKQV